MTIKTFIVGSTLVAVWSGAPTVADCDAVLAAVRRARDHTGGLAGLVAVLAPDVSVPSSEVRTRMRELWPELARHGGEAIQFVNLTPSLVGAQLLSFVVSFFALLPQGKLIYVHRSVPPALVEAARADPTVIPADMQRMIAALLPPLAGRP